MYQLVIRTHKRLNPINNFNDNLLKLYFYFYRNMDLEELYHKYRIRLKQSLFTTFASIGLVVCTATLVMFILFHSVSMKAKNNNYININ